MRRALFILSVFIVMALSGQDARAAEFGTRSRYQHLQNLTEKSPHGEALALGYVSVTHSFIMPYKMTGNYVLTVRGSGKDLNGRPIDVYHELSQDQIAQMQLRGALPNPLPPHHHTIFEYMMAYVMWWILPVTLLFIAIFSKLGIGSGTRDEIRSA